MGRTWTVNCVQGDADTPCSTWNGARVGCPQAYLNGVDVPYIFHLNTLVAKVLGAVGSVAGGLAIGKEGPFVHAGAAIAAIISQVPGPRGKGVRRAVEATKARHLPGVVLGARTGREGIKAVRRGVEESLKQVKRCVGTNALPAGAA